MVLKLSESALTLLCKRYLRPLEGSEICIRCGKAHETPEQAFERASFGSDVYYKMLTSLEFLPNSPTLFNAGHTGTYSACFKFDVYDSMASIMEVATKSATVQKWGGGVGYCLSHLRGEGEPIRSTHGKACGPMAVLQLYQSVAEMITQGGKRMGAQMGVLRCDHPDIEAFIKCKSDSKSFDTFNLSVACTDTFMKQAINDLDSSPHKLLRMIAENAWKQGDPGIYFIDAAEYFNPTPHLGKLTGTNPCGEVPLLDNEPCNLGSINLAKFVCDDRTFNFDGLYRLAKTAAQYLDDVVEKGMFPVQMIGEAAKLTRKIGLGVMGWADTLALMRIPYASTRATDLAERIMCSIRESAREYSLSAAEEKGPYPAYNSETSRTPKQRNATLTCIAPTGSIAVLAGCSSGIEPHYMLEGTRMMGDGTLLKEVVATNGFVPSTAHEIEPIWHIRHQAAFQNYTDLAVSKTINMREDVSVDDVYNAFVVAWEQKCKGLTIYRDKSRMKQVLTSSVSVSEASEGLNGRRRMPTNRPALVHKFTVANIEGYIISGRFSDGLLGEVFVKASRQGSTIDGLLDAVAILTSLALQYGVPLEVLVEKFRGTRFEPRGMTGNPEIPVATSLIDYIFRYLGKCFDVIATQLDTGMICPDCGASAVYQDSCLECKDRCGWTQC